jgi:hypothetical protein
MSPSQQSQQNLGTLWSQIPPVDWHFTPLPSLLFCVIGLTILCIVAALLSPPSHKGQCQRTLWITQIREVKVLLELAVDIFVAPEFSRVWFKNVEWMSKWTDRRMTIMKLQRWVSLASKWCLFSFFADKMHCQRSLILPSEHHDFFRVVFPLLFFFWNCKQHHASWGREYSTLKHSIIFKPNAHTACWPHNISVPRWTLLPPLGFSSHQNLFLGRSEMYIPSLSVWALSNMGLIWQKPLSFSFPAQSFLIGSPHPHHSSRWTHFVLSYVKWIGWGFCFTYISRRLSFLIWKVT